jgi:hypothetical protein
MGGQGDAIWNSLNQPLVPDTKSSRKMRFSRS